MTHYKDLQDSMPVFVKTPNGITWQGKTYKRGEEFPWKTLKVTFEQTKLLFTADLIYHNDVLASEQDVGDGLDKMTIDQLHHVVETINESVKKNAGGNKTKFNKEKCKKSRVLSKQKGLIRSWRNNFGHLEA